MMTYRVKRILWGLVFVAIGIGYLGGLHHILSRLVDHAADSACTLQHAGSRPAFL